MQPNIPQYKAKGINKFVPIQTIDEVLRIKRKWERKKKKLETMMQYANTPEKTLAIMEKLKQCENFLNVEMVNQNTLRLDANDVRRALPKKKQRKLGMIPATAFVNETKA